MNQTEGMSEGVLHEMYMQDTSRVKTSQSYISYSTSNFDIFEYLSNYNIRKNLHRFTHTFLNGKLILDKRYFIAHKLNT